MRSNIKPIYPIHTVDLFDVTSALESVDDMTNAYYDTETGSIVVYNPDFDDIPDPAADLQRYIPLPDTHVINDYQIMQEFVEEIGPKISESAQSKLSQSLIGKGAFQRFRDTVSRLGLSDAWNDYHNEAYEFIARQWAKDEGIEIV